MKRLALLVALAFTNWTHAQEQNCSCNQAFEKLVAKVETEYPGFEHKAKDQISYTDFKENVAQEANKSGKDACVKLLKKYIDYFKDPHMWISSIGTSTSETDTPENSIAIDIQDFKNKTKFTKDTYEGIWSNENYTFGIKKTGEKEYTGFIIEAKSDLWKPKNIKFKLFSNGAFEYALLDRTVKKGNYQLYHDGILFLEGVDVAVVKQTPKPAGTAKQIKDKLNELQGFYFKVFRQKLYRLNTKLLERFSKKSGNDLVTVLTALLFNTFPFAHSKYKKKYNFHISISQLFSIQAIAKRFFQSLFPNTVIVC